MSSGRRSTRTQTNNNKRPRYQGEGDDNYHSNEFAQGMHVHNMHAAMGMMMGNMAGAGWHTGHHVPTEGHFNMGYQYQYNTASYPPHHQYTLPHQQFHKTHQQYHHSVEVPQGGADEEPGPSSGRSLRARAVGGTTVNMAATRGRKGGTGTASTTNMAHSAPNTQRGEPAAKDTDEDDDEEEEAGTSSKPKNPHKVETTLTVDQMLQNCLYYLLLQQHKKVPVKRSDLIKNAMNSQHKQFSEVMKKLENILDDVFGMSLVQLGKGKDNMPCVVTGPVDGANAVTEEVEEASAGKKGKVKGSSGASASYILVSKFPSSVIDASMLVMARRDPEADSKNTVLYLVLATIFMLNRSIDEEIIWKIITEMDFSQMVCEKKEDLRKFLKSEYVSPGYLNMETTEQQNHPSVAKHSLKEPAPTGDGGIKSSDTPEPTKAKYSWGPRADKEYSKYAMLKFVTARFPGRKMYEFTVQYNMVQRQEKDVIDRDLFDDRDTDGEQDQAASASANAANGSALKIRQRAGGKGETFSIDGENTETETEGAE